MNSSTYSFPPRILASSSSARLRTLALSSVFGRGVDSFSILGLLEGRLLDALLWTSSSLSDMIISSLLGVAVRPGALGVGVSAN